MDVVNGQIKNLADGADNTDAPTVEQSTSMYEGTTKHMLTKTWTGTATTSGGTATFYLTDDGTGSGAAIFSTVVKSSANFWIESTTSQYQFGNYTLSGDKKTLTVSVTYLSASTGNVLLNLLGAVTSVLTGLTYSAVPNGVTVHMSIRGK